MSSVASDIRKFIIETFHFGEDDGSIGVGTSLVRSGVIDSTGTLELVLFLEKTYSISVRDFEIVPENFDTLECLARFVESKRAVAG